MIAIAFLSFMFAAGAYWLQKAADFDSYCNKFGFWTTWWIFFFGSISFIVCMFIYLWRHFE